MRNILISGGLGTLLVVAAGCGEAGQSGTAAPDLDPAGEGCAPVPGEQLVVLDDDLGLQTVDNLVPAINAEVADPALVAALDAVSAALDTDQLIALNQAVNSERQTPEQAAGEFADAQGFTDGIEAGPGGELVVGTADFSESQTVGALYAIALEAAGYTVEVRTVGNRELYEPALERGEIDIVPEYLGTLTEFLNAQVNGADPEPLASSDVTATAGALQGLGDEVGLVFGEPSQAANQNAFAVTEAFADEHGVSTLSEFAEVCSGAATVLGGPPECPQRPFCQPGLQDVYELRAGEFASLDAGGPLTKQALRTGEITIGLVFSADGDLASD